MQKISRLFVAIALTTLSVLPTFPAGSVQSHNEPDAPIVFRFIPGDLMFYDSPKLGFGESLAKSIELIETHKEDITSGKAVVVIHGFCTSFASDGENMRAAKNRSNQVKSYFITNHWMKEEFYRTRNHITPYQGMKDVVAVVRVEYLPGYGLAEEKPQAIACALEPCGGIPVPSAYEGLMAADMTEKCLDASKTRTRDFVDIPLIIKSNLVYDVMLAPSLEIEYMFTDKWSFGVETSIAWWHNNHKNRFYQMATLIPEVRYSIGGRKKDHRHIIGLFGGGGWYDLENKKTGYQGELWMVGLSYSYYFPINKLLGFEAGAGLGFMRAKYDEYLPVDGHYSYTQTSRTNFFGPLRVKFALVFDLDRFFKKGGNR